jgi:hypothetical protein
MAYEYEYIKGLRPQAPVAKPHEHDPRNRRRFVSFQSNIPEKVALAHPDGVHKNGMYGPRVMYTLIDGRVMWLDPDVAARIKTMGMLPGQEFWIVKRKPAGRGQKTRWNIYQEDPTPLVGESPLESDLRLSLHEIERQRSMPKEQSAPPQPQPSSVSPPRPVDTPPAEGVQEVALSVMSKKKLAWAQSLVGQTNQLVDAYAECILHAAQHGLTVKPEDVRTLLVTAFINLSQRGRTSA